MLKIFLLCLLGVGVYGGYYGYCVYKTGDRKYAMSQEAQGLHQALMRLSVKGNINADSVRQVVGQMATKARVEARGPIVVTIEPLNESSQKKLPAFTQSALGIAARMPRHNQPKYVVGFRGRFYAKHKIASRTFDMERYTWFQWVDPQAVTPSGP